MTRPFRTSLLVLPALATLLACEPAPEPHAPAAGEPAGEAHAPQSAPLKAIMAALAADMSVTAMGLWTEDPATVSAAAGRIAEHPGVPPSQMAAIQVELGARFTEFVAFDGAVHDLAVELRDAASAGRPAGELAPLYAEMATGCVGCHTSFRARLLPALADSTAR